MPRAIVSSKMICSATNMASWMASTGSFLAGSALVFPRIPMFSTVIFDYSYYYIMINV